jgi:two-component system, OmpR family, phosphate regulon sensor histidine kinase PhoR
MLKNRIWLIVILMSTALLGIILVQVYWIRNTIVQKEQVFNFHVNEALNKVADKVETNIAASVVSSQMNLFFSDSTYWGAGRDSLTIYEGILSDSMLAVALASAKTAGVDYFRADVAAVEPFGHEISPMPKASDRPIMILEPLEYKGDSRAADDALISDILTDIDRQLRINSQRIKKAMEQMMFQMMQRGIKPEQTIDTVFLKNTLFHELGNRGITTEFNYGVYMDDELFITNAGNKEDVKELTATTHKVSLFPDDMFFNNDELLVEFPHQKSFILSSIWSLLIGSLLFTSIIIGVFYYTVVIMLRQKKLSEIKNDFINNMTHEFKTPLATISLAVDAVNNPMILKDENKVKHYTHIIKEENKRMNSQVEKVLQMALLDKNEISLSTDDIDIHDIIYRAVENISVQVEEKGGKIEMELAAEQYELIGDEVHLSNVISNLLDNANKYSPEQPDIKISTESNSSGIFITVEDHGIGMNSDDVKMIFEKFYRVPTGNVHNIKGFGLGLTYVKAIIEAHNGTIDVKSQPKKGSQFKLFLPIT